MTEWIASLSNVAVEYRVGGQVIHALSGANLDLRPGSSTAVVGRSGSGKSSLVSVLALLRQPSRGAVTIAGQPVAQASDARLSELRGRFVGTVFQSFHLDPTFSAVENVMLSWYFGIGGRRGDAARRARDLLGLVGIADLAQRRTGQMSGGQRQRVAIARALFNEPVLLIADEPTGNLDEDTAGEIADVMFGLPSETGTAIVVVTHDSDIARRAQCVLRIAHGSLEAPSDVHRGPDGG